MITAQMIRDALARKPEGFFIDHEFSSALRDGFPMYHDAPIVGKWLESLGFTVTGAKDEASYGYAQTEEGIRVYRGGWVHGPRYADGR